MFSIPSPNSARNVLYRSYCNGNLPYIWAIIFNIFTVVLGSKSWRQRDEQPVDGEGAHGVTKETHLRSGKNQYLLGYTKRKRGWLQIKTSLPAASGAYFDYFFTCLTICVQEVPWEVGEGAGEKVR